ncbi:MAG TPA: Na+/H+ antiporter [Mucilaginibacter sp.]|jgi:CPA1 family monovalent cation:H+ antiporter
MHEILLLCLGLVLSVSFLVLLAQKLKIAYPILLVAAGLAIGFIPGIPNTHINPDLVFLIILPPVLYDAAQNTSWKAMWRWRRIIVVLALIFVFLTATAVAFASYYLIPGFTLAQGFLLGAIVSPPDASAAVAILRFVKLPKGVVAILEGESLLNDATSLTIFRFALMAIVSNTFVWQHAATNFVLVVVSGIAIGLAIGFVFYVVFRWLPTTANLNITLSIVIPYLIYVTAEAVHSSGVLAVVSGGLFIAYQNHFVFSHSSRLKSNAIWSALVFILNAVVFFVIGLQLPEIMYSIKDGHLADAIKVALIISLVVILVRVLFLLSSSAFTTFIGRFITVALRRPGWRNPMISGLMGMRGVVSLASALSVPLLLPAGQAFPYRDLILFITFTVIVITLVGQGLILPWVIKKIRPQFFLEEKSDDEQIEEIELQLYHSALEKMRAKYPCDIEENAFLKNKHELYSVKVELLGKNSAEKTPNQLLNRFKKIMIEVIEHERRELHAFRKKDGYDDDVIRIIENRLDLEEERLEEETE